MSQLIGRHGFIYDQLPAILWAVLIFVASSIPNAALPEIRLSDKIVHLVIYLILCVLIDRALTHQRRFQLLARWSLGCAVLLTVLYGVSDELHQSFTPGRDASLGDIAADSIGAILFLGYALIKKRHNPV